MHNIYCVGRDIPGDEFEYIPFNSDTSLLDADIVLFELMLDYERKASNPTYQGLPNLSAESSVENRKSLKHWRRELSEAFQAGKTIFIFLRKPVKVYAATGTEERTGTGRSQKVIRHVNTITSYEALPVEFDSLATARGRKVKFSKDGNLLTVYWETLSKLSHYEVHYDHQKSTPLMYTRTGERTVASLIKADKGHLLMLPVLDFDQDEFVDYDEENEKLVWTEEGLRYGRTLLSAIVEIHKHLLSTSVRSPAPEWTQEDRFQLQGEAEIKSHIQTVDKKLEKLSAKRKEFEDQLEGASLPTALLYEKGKALELAVIDALSSIGFEASEYTDEESQFDVVFESDEGRFIGEAEGKDRRAVNIDKLQQLERNIQEDFARESVKEFAKGVLFGNPHRLLVPAERGVLFTQKAVSAAKRSGFALVHTADLFPIVKYLKENEDHTFALEVRKCFASTSGEVIEFPQVPEGT